MNIEDTYLDELTKNIEGDGFIPPIVQNEEKLKVKETHFAICSKIQELIDYNTQIRNVDSKRDMEKLTNEICTLISCIYIQDDKFTEMIDVTDNICQKYHKLGPSKIKKGEIKPSYIPGIIKFYANSFCNPSLEKMDFETLSTNGINKPDPFYISNGSSKSHGKNEIWKHESFYQPTPRS